MDSVVDPDSIIYDVLQFIVAYLLNIGKSIKKYFFPVEYDLTDSCLVLIFIAFSEAKVFLFLSVLSKSNRKSVPINYEFVFFFTNRYVDCSESAVFILIMDRLFMIDSSKLLWRNLKCFRIDGPLFDYLFLSTKI